MKTGLTVLVAGLAFAGMAAADEVWTTQIGDVIYETELPQQKIAVLSYPLSDGDALPVDNDAEEGIDPAPRGRVYIYDLAGVYTGRGAFTGVWIEPEGTRDESDLCDTAIVNPETGATVYNWGRVDLVFTEPDFPGGWVAMRGDCFDHPDQYLIGKPVVGGE